MALTRPPAGSVAATLETIHEFPGAAWLTNDAANHPLALIVVPGVEDDPEKIRHTGMHHHAYEYPSMDDLLDATWTSRRRASSRTPARTTA